MVRLLGSELFISLMSAVAFISLFEFFLGQGRIDSAVIYVALLFSSIGLLVGLLAHTATGRRGR